MKEANKLPKDFKEFIELLNSHRVDHLIIGGTAFGYHAQPRYTKDLDVWIRRDEATAKKMCSAVHEFGFAKVTPKITEDAFLAPGQCMQLGYDPHRIDIINDLSPLSFNDAWDKREEISIDGTTLTFIDRETLIESKRIAGRPQDLADIEKLERTRPDRDQSHEKEEHDQEAEPDIEEDDFDRDL